jgi:hypothetical protein
MVTIFGFGIDAKYSIEQIKKIENYFGNLNNLKDFFNKDEKECKSNKAGTKANVKLKYVGICSFALSKTEINGERYIRIYSKELKLNVDITIEEYPNKKSGCVKVKVQRDPTNFLAINALLDPLFLVSDAIVMKIKNKIEEVAYYH